MKCSGIFFGTNGFVLIVGASALAIELRGAVDYREVLAGIHSPGFSARNSRIQFTPTKIRGLECQ